MATSGPVGVGIIGAGNISDTYLENLSSFPDIRVMAVGDQATEVARAKARAFDVPVAGDVDVVLGHPEVEIVVNLTPPLAHAEVASRAVSAGKSVWNEKPLTLDLESARALLTLADAAGVRVGCAPDTFLGAGLQTARRMLEEGAIGAPLTAMVMLQSAGPDLWHPNPAFLFQEGAGPLLDMGPYYLTALVQTFGPVATVTATGTSSKATRVVKTGPRAGESFAVTVPSHVSALVVFESGQSATLTFSFDSPIARDVLEVTGLDATCTFPDPNRFDGDIVIQRPFQAPDPATTTVAAGSRGLGVLDMARAIRAGVPHRAQGALAYHVLETMIRMSESISSRSWLSVESSVDSVPPLPGDWDPYASTV